MNYFTLSKILPNSISKVLFGNREKFGLSPDVNDSCWIEWQKQYHNFYLNTQKKGVGSYVNDAGYKILKKIDLTGLNILEIGPGSLPHMRFWNGKPANYVLIDIDENFLATALEKLKKQNISCETRLTNRDNIKLPANNNEFDLIISFYSLEHLNPISSYLQEFKRVLKPNGCLVGAIPMEGGCAWGLGRYFTSRRWLKKHTTINPDKIICWEHPNFAAEIINNSQKQFMNEVIDFWPLKIPLIDINLIAKFIFRKKDA